MKKKIVVDEDVYRQLKMMKGKSESYGSAIKWIIEKSKRSVVFENDVIEWLLEQQEYNKYDNINETIKEMISELEKRDDINEAGEA